MPKPTKVAGLTAETPLAEAAPKILLARLHDMRRYEPTGDNAKLDELETVHDMRVASRRLRAAVKLLGDKKLRRLDRDIKALQDALGEKRQLQLDIAWLEERPDDAKADGARLLLSREYERLQKANEKLDKELEGWRETIAPRIAKRIKKIRKRGRLGGRKMRRRLRDQLEKFSAQLDRARPPLQPDFSHKLRIQTKKLRYQLEILAPVFEGLDRAIETVLPDLQTELGDLHDSDSRIALLTAFAKDAEVPIRGELKHLMDDQQKERFDRARKLLAEMRAVDLKDKLSDLVPAKRRAEATNGVSRDAKAHPAAAP